MHYSIPDWLGWMFLTSMFFMVSSTFTGKVLLVHSVSLVGFLSEKNFCFNKVFDYRKFSTAVSSLIPLELEDSIVKPPLEMPGDRFPPAQPMHPSCTHPHNILSSLVALPKRRSNSHTWQHFHMAEGLLYWRKCEDIVSYKERNSSWSLEPNQRKGRAIRKALALSLCHLTCIMTVYTGSFLAA